MGNCCGSKKASVPDDDPADSPKELNEPENLEMKQEEHNDINEPLNPEKDAEANNVNIADDEDPAKC